MLERNEHSFAGAAGTATFAQPRDVERIVDISGTTPEGRPKAHVLLHHYEQYSDGTIKDIHTMTVDKPIVNIFKHAGFVNVSLDFGNSYDRDLKIMYDLLTEFQKPSNSVSYLPEELESGYYETPDGPKMVYFPILNLALSPIGKESSYMIHGYNPAFFTLAPNQIHGSPCVIQFTFMEETFAVVNDLDRIDPAQVHAEVMAELEAEQHGYVPNL